MYTETGLIYLVKHSIQVYVKNKCEGFIVVSKYQEVNESTRPLRPSAVICFQMFG